MGGECCPSGRDSLNLLVLFFLSGGVSLSQVDVAFNVIGMSVIDIYWSVIFHCHLCLGGGGGVCMHESTVRASNRACVHAWVGARLIVYVCMNLEV